jgi:hypothetical protein
MAIRKTYQSIHFITHDTYVDANGKKVQVLFRGGSLKPRINGKYSTSDPAIIAALDRGLNAKGATYRLISSEDDGIEEPVQEVKAEVKAPKAPPADPPAAPPADVPEGFIEVKDIATVQKARDYLVANFEGITAAKLPNGPAIKKFALENKIAFTDLK